MPEVVRCEICTDFKNPIDYRNEGNCMSYEDGLKTHNPEQIQLAYKARGNCKFIGCTRRFCKVFKSREEV